MVWHSRIVPEATIRLRFRADVCSTFNVISTIIRRGMRSLLAYFVFTSNSYNEIIENFINKNSLYGSTCSAQCQSGEECDENL